MAVEIEAKMKIDDAESVAARLRERGATALGNYAETNTFYDTEDRTLLAGDQGLRVRASTNVETGQTQCVLTHKGPCKHGPLKAREETEVMVGNADDAGRLLEQIGFKRYMRFQKRRQSWKLEDCSIELDEVPYLGHFVEIEGPNDAAVMRVRELLGLADRPLIKAGYIALLSGHMQERGQATRDISFPAQAMGRGTRAS